QLNLRKVLFTCIAYGAATLAWSSLILASLDVIRDITRTYDEHGSKGDAVFIPFGWPHLKPGKYYAGDVPEWEMFRQISINPKYLAAQRGEDIGGAIPIFGHSATHKRIDELVAIVLDVVSKEQHIHQLTGDPIT